MVRASIVAYYVAIVCMSLVAVPIEAFFVQQARRRASFLVTTSFKKQGMFTNGDDNGKGAVASAGARRIRESPMNTCLYCLRLAMKGGDDDHLSGTRRRGSPRMFTVFSQKSRGNGDGDSDPSGPPPRLLSEGWMQLLLIVIISVSGYAVNTNLKDIQREQAEMSSSLKLVQKEQSTLNLKADAVGYASGLLLAVVAGGGNVVKVLEYFDKKKKDNADRNQS
jgi:hypothetical protein